jgi:glycosyltransferase involved in cell wall biosynthesis
MRVLHLVAGNLYGGIETLLVTLARLRHLAPEMEPAFGLCFRARLWDELQASGVPVHDLGRVRISRPWTVWRARRCLRRLLSESPPDTAVVHGCWPHLVFAPTIRSSGIQLGHMVHGEVAGRRLLERWAARTRPDLVVANSQFAAASAERLFAGIPTQVVYPPLPASEPDDRAAARRRIRAEFATPDDAVVILMVSRIEALKGHRTLLDALGRLREVASWTCWIVGGAQRPAEAKLLTELQQRVAALGLAERVRFLGPRADVATVMAAADVYCQPNVGAEGFGLTFVEALRAGLPVVTSAFGGALEIVDGATGILTPPGDAMKLAEALGVLIRDPARRAELGAAGPARTHEICDPSRQLSRLAAALAAGKETAVVGR